MLQAAPACLSLRPGKEYAHKYRTSVADIRVRAREEAFVMRRYVLTAGVAALLVCLAFGVAGCGGTSTTEQTPAPAPTEPAEEPVAESPFAVGDNVAAVWDDGNFYLAEVMAVQGDDITVQYADDDSVKTVPASDVRTIEIKTWSVGDKVLAVWSSGRFYSGEIVEANDPTYVVEWDDGSVPSDVTSDKIIPFE